MNSEKSGRPLDWTCPYPANRAPVFAENLVATSQPLAAAAGLSALRQGGNAVDAALATAITLTVVEPCSNGIGSDAFALIYDGTKLHGLNASGRSPAAMTPERFKGLTQMPTLGWESVTLPGAVSGWVAMSERFGKLPFEALFAEAIRYAMEGFIVAPKTGLAWQQAATHFRDYKPFMDTFMRAGKAPAIGACMQLPAHARSLEKIAHSKGEAFYQGELAEQIAADAARHKAALTLADLQQHKAEWVAPISMSAFDITLHEIPPNTQGLIALIALGIIKQLDIADFAVDSADSLHLQIEALRIASAEAAQHLADPDDMQIAIAELLDDARLAQAAASIDIHHSRPRPAAPSTQSDTVYLTTADAEGMMVSMIQSNFHGFGSGIVVPGTGISLQNRGAGFVLDAGHVNQVGPSKRPYHTIIPGFITAGAEAVMSFGVMGGHFQAQGHLQMTLRVCLYGQNPQAASDAPRWCLLPDGRLALEPGLIPEVINDLESRGHAILRHQPESLFGGAQLLYKLPRGYCGGSDHRKEGLATGF